MRSLASRGSIRIPASFTGTVGLKPSNYLKLGCNTTKLTWGTNQTAWGTITRSTADATYVFDALTNNNNRFYNAINNIKSYKGNIGTMAFLPTLPYAIVDPKISRVMSSVLMKLNKSFDIQYISDLGFSINPEKAAATLWLDILLIYKQMYNDKLEKMDPYLQKLLCNRPGKKDIDESNEIKKIIINAIDTIFEKYDFILMPTVAVLPWAAGHNRPGLDETKIIGCS